MTKKTILFLFIVLTWIIANISAQTTHIDPDSYILKSGDIFFIQSSIVDSLVVRTPILPEGSVSLFPFADSVYVAGLTLTEAYDRIHNKVGGNVSTNRFLIQLGSISPIRFSIHGAIRTPGEYNVDSVITLMQAVLFADGFAAQASRRVKILRGATITEYDLNLFLTEGDTRNNPFIMQDDIIMVNLAEEYVSVYTIQDPSITLQVIEFSYHGETISDMLTKLLNRFNLSNLETFTVLRGDQYFTVDKNFSLQHEDKLYIAMEELFVYVTGFVARPGRLFFNGVTEPRFYIAQSGGVIPNGSLTKIYLIQNNGDRVRYVGQDILPGDTIFVPESLRSQIISWLVPTSTVISLIYTLILIGVSI